jgi:hypothetical protein
VVARAILALQKGDRGAAGELEGGRGTGHAGPDDDDVHMIHELGSALRSDTDDKAKSGGIKGLRVRLVFRHGFVLRSFRTERPRFRQVARAYHDLGFFSTEGMPKRPPSASIAALEFLLQAS